MAKKPKHRGRPPAGKVVLSERVMVRATPAHVDEWQAAAFKAGFIYNGEANVGGWLRSLAERELGS
jgi:hypothetical protein